MNGLGLGQIPFPPGYKPYTPPERRGRKRRAAAQRATRGARARRGVVGSPGGTVAKAGAGHWLSINPDGGTNYVPFLGVQRERIRGALGASVASHVVGIVLLLLVIRAAPATEAFFEVNRTNYQLVWIPQAGPGGGGGGGGNESLEMPRLAEVAGEDDLSVPIEVPDEVEAPPDVEPEPEQQPLESQNMRLTVLPMAAAQQTRAGLLERLLARSLDSAGSGAGGGAGAGNGAGIGPGQGDGLGPGQGGGSGGGPYRPGNGVETPRPIREIKPRYTAEAMRAKVQGAVWLEAVVLPDGSVGDVRIIRSLDRNFGLDDEAVKAAKQWRFIPGTRFGEPVAVLVTIELTFTLR
ncbi:MAG: energy transducer TonB [Acidobacteria bacterium]|nr:MAG: energy transducer TonB [Acidobacteriota bacterium]